MYVNSLVCDRVKGGENEWFMIQRGVRKGYNMLPWIFKVFMECDEGGQNGNGEEGSKIPGGG